MAIRDGLSIDLDGAKTEAVVRKGTLRYVAPPPPSRLRRLATVFLAVMLTGLVLGAVYYFYLQRDGSDSLRLEVSGTDLGSSDELSVTVFIHNGGPKAHSYVLTTSQSFGLEIRNGTGGIVSEYAPAVTPEARQVTVEPGQSLRLGTFSWNRTLHGYDGENETWTPVPPGDYVIRAYFKGSADIAAEKRISIA